MLLPQWVVYFIGVNTNITQADFALLTAHVQIYKSVQMFILFVLVFLKPVISNKQIVSLRSGMNTKITNISNSLDAKKAKEEQTLLKEQLQAANNNKINKNRI